jgi:diguanylate cyclase (GGDEF)-like protein
MALDPRTLLFCLILTNILAMLSLVVATTSGSGKQDGMGKWAIAMFLETLTWALVSARGLIPDLFSVIVANALKAGSHTLILMAICEFQRRSPPRWQLFVPVALTLLMVAILADNMRGRVLWGSLIYGFQMALIARALLSDPETRAGQAWKLLFGGIAAIMLVLVLRAVAALSGIEFSQPADAAAHPVQIIVFVAMMASAMLGSIGFVLLVKERADREILHLAMTDSLTGVANRRALMEQAEHALSRRNGLPLALLMIDVDYFKRINDTHGHPAGDEVLRKVAVLMAGRLRGHDVLGRYGGEEFCVIAPDTDAEGALALAESLRRVIAATPLAAERGAVPVTVSIGVAHCPANTMRELKDLLAEADAMLYTAKQTGRDRVVTSSSPVHLQPAICV